MAFDSFGNTGMKISENVYFQLKFLKHVFQICLKDLNLLNK